MGLQVPGLQPFKASLEEIYDNFNKYKRTVPVRCVCAVGGVWVGAGSPASPQSTVPPAHPPACPSACLGRGAILLDPDMTKCLLVRGYKKDAGWGFPRGKLSKDETDAQCAEREVWGWGGGE